MNKLTFFLKFNNLKNETTQCLGVTNFAIITKLIAQAVAIGMTSALLTNRFSIYNVMSPFRKLWGKVDCGETKKNHVRIKGSHISSYAR